MRITLVLLSFIFLSAAVNTPANKLENTRWEGTMKIPSETYTVIEFKKDSSFIWVDNMVIEAMSYTVSGDTLTLAKLYGSSPCAYEKGIYQFTINNNLLKIIAVNDPCHDRVAAWNAEGYKKE